MTKKSVELTEGLCDLTKKISHQVEQKKEVGEVQIQDAVMTEHTLRLLPSDLIENLESAVTSVSRKQQLGGSMTTVLQQALQSDDTEQLDWIIMQTEQQLINSTIKALGSDFVGKLFAVILFKFQSEQADK